MITLIDNKIAYGKTSILNKFYLTDFKRCDIFIVEMKVNLFL